MRAALVERATEPTSHRIKLQLWAHLAEGEAESYMAHLSLKRGLKIADPSSVIARLGDEWSQHCLARKRYLIWAATKDVAASQVGAENHELDLADEIRLRGEWLASRLGSGRVNKSEYCFIPESLLRTPTLLKTMQEHILPLGEKYWTEVPADYFARNFSV
ncbi:hypothetical protein ACHZ97_18940 [Lysobacter soli]|uniref:hypothetical protein n=1 Tax=Lysobacter soli TaxID=453783 RepID=UPI0037C7E2FA